MRISHGPPRGSGRIEDACGESPAASLDGGTFFILLFVHYSCAIRLLFAHYGRLGRLGAIWGDPGGSWRALGGVLGRSWAVLGRSWGPKSTQEHPKTAPRRPKSDPRPPQDRSKIGPRSLQEKNQRKASKSRKTEKLPRAHAHAHARAGPVKPTKKHRKKVRLHRTHAHAHAHAKGKK